MTKTAPVPEAASGRRSRNSVETKAAILRAARKFFLTEGYDHVGLRQIAAEAGVDKALVNRYFGSKEELFRAVLESLEGPLLVGQNEAGIAAITAEQIVRPNLDDPALEDMLITLRSALSPDVAGIARERFRDQVVGRLASAIGGPEAELRATLVMAVFTGAVLMREVLKAPALAQGDDAAIEKHLETLFLAALQIGSKTTEA